MTIPMRFARQRAAHIASIALAITLAPGVPQAITALAPPAPGTMAGFLTWF